MTGVEPSRTRTPIRPRGSWSSGRVPADSKIDGLARLDAGAVEDRWAAARALETFERNAVFTQPAADEVDATGEASPAG